MVPRTYVGGHHGQPAARGAKSYGLGNHSAGEESTVEMQLMPRPRARLAAWPQSISGPTLRWHPGHPAATGRPSDDAQ